MFSRMRRLTKRKKPVKKWAGQDVGKNWESVLITLANCMLREFIFVVHKLLSGGPVQLPLSPVIAHSLQG